MKEYMKIYEIDGNRKNCIVYAADEKEAAIKPDDIILNYLGHPNRFLIGVYDYINNKKGKINHLESIVEEGIKRHEQRRRESNEKMNVVINRKMELTPNQVNVLSHLKQNTHDYNHVLDTLHIYLKESVHADYLNLNETEKNEVIITYSDWIMNAQHVEGDKNE